MQPTHLNLNIASLLSVLGQILQKMSSKVKSATLLLGHWYEMMALYYVKSILTEISATRQDKRVLQKSKVLRIKFFEHMGRATDV